MLECRDDIEIHSQLCIIERLCLMYSQRVPSFVVFFFNDTATTEIYTLSLHDVFRSSKRNCKSIHIVQATKGYWWMPWRWKPMKDVEDCDKPRLVVKQTLNRGFPNGETQFIYKLLLSEYIG